MRQRPNNTIPAKLSSTLEVLGRKTTGRLISVKATLFDINLKAHFWRPCLLTGEDYNEAASEKVAPRPGLGTGPTSASLPHTV